MNPLYVTSRTSLTVSHYCIISPEDFRYSTVFYAPGLEMKCFRPFRTSECMRSFQVDQSEHRHVFLKTSCCLDVTFLWIVLMRILDLNLNVVGLCTEIGRP